MSETHEEPVTRERVTLEICHYCLKVHDISVPCPDYSLTLASGKNRAEALAEIYGNAVAEYREQVDKLTDENVRLRQREGEARDRAYQATGFLNAAISQHIKAKPSGGFECTKCHGEWEGDRLTHGLEKRHCPVAAWCAFLADGRG